MVSAVTTSLVWFLQGVGFVVDVLLYIPSRVFQDSSRIKKESVRLKAKPLHDDPRKPWRAVDHFESLTTTPIDGLHTLRDLFSHSVSQYKDLPSLGTREFLSCEDETQSNGRVFKKLVLGKYEWMTFADVEEKVDNLGSVFIRKLGLHPGDKVCIFMETRAEWLLFAWTCFKYNFQLVTIYSTLGEDGIVHGMNEAEPKLVITSAELMAKMQKISSRLPKLQYVIYCRSLTVDKPQLDVGGSVQVFSMERIENPAASLHPDLTSSAELLQLDEYADMPSEVTARPDDVAVIMYTSGTTGTPKGVMLTHANLLAALSGQCQRILNLGTTDRYLAYLPLAHVLELTAELGCFIFGARLGYSSPGTITDQSTMIKKGCHGDASQLKPTLIACVPTVLDRIYKAVWDKVKASGSVGEAVFRFAYAYKLRNYNWGFETPIMDGLVFNKIRQTLGGQLRMMVSGSAPLSEDTQRFMQLVLGCTVGQGYGLTETTGAGAVQEVTDRSVGKVGHPVFCSQILLRDWDEGGYMVNNSKPQGEILIGGAHVAKGYFKMPDKTKEEFIMIDGIRYFCTGDVGEFQPDGTLKIIDRKKDLVKLQHGEYVSLAKVEVALKNIPIVDNICVYGDSYKDYVVALVQVNSGHLRSLAHELKLGQADGQELCENSQVKENILKQLHHKSKEAKLEKWEVPLKVALVTEPWTPDNGMLSDTLKLKRRNIATGHIDSIKAMYT